MRLVLFLPLLLAACTSPESAPPMREDPPRPASAVETPVPESPPRPAFVIETFLRAAVGSPREPIDHADIVRLLGEPQRVDVATHPNVHDDAQTDTLRTFVYPGLAATAFSGTGSPARFLTRVEITDAAIDTPSGVRVGQSVASMIAQLGEPDFRFDSGAFGYEAYGLDPDATPPQLILIPDASGESVAEVHYAMYVG